MSDVLKPPTPRYLGTVPGIPLPETPEEAIERRRKEAAHEAGREGRQFKSSTIYRSKRLRRPGASGRQYHGGHHNSDED